MHDAPDRTMCEAPKVQVPSRPRDHALRSFMVVLASVVAGVGLLLGYGLYYHSQQYPYGWSHCCDKGMLLALFNYAHAHGGRFPAGEATPEASLSLLYPTYIDAGTLRGKTVPQEVVESLLTQGKRLGSDTCGWHYVPGLTVRDDHKLALLWDKIGLGHNGQRLPEGGHYVIFVGCQIEYISGAEWPAFMKKQEELLAKRRGRRPSTSNSDQ